MWYCNTRRIIAYFIPHKIYSWCWSCTKSPYICIRQSANTTSCDGKFSFQRKKQPKKNIFKSTSIAFMDDSNTRFTKNISGNRILKISDAWPISTDYVYTPMAWIIFRLMTFNFLLCNSAPLAFILCLKKNTQKTNKPCGWYFDRCFPILCLFLVLFTWFYAYVKYSGECYLRSSFDNNFFLLGNVHQWNILIMRFSMKRALYIFGYGERERERLIILCREWDREGERERKSENYNHGSR